MTVQVDYERVADCVLALAMATGNGGKVAKEDAVAIERMAALSLSGIVSRLGHYAIKSDIERGALEIDTHGAIDGSSLLHSLEAQMVGEVCTAMDIKCLPAQADVAVRLRQRLNGLPGPRDAY